MIRSRNSFFSRKYVRFVIICVLAVFTIQTFVNYIDIQSNIQSIADKDKYLQEEISYLHHFQKPYLWSKYYREHRIHDMGLISSGEYIIKIDALKDINPSQTQRNTQYQIEQNPTLPVDPQILQPIQARYHLRKTMQSKS